jgi:spore germination protein YaaH
MKLLQISLLSILTTFVLGQEQPPKTIHQEQFEYYESIGKDYKYYEDNYISPDPVNYEKSNCTLEKKVFGWHPYWSNGKEANYQWDLLTDLSYFGYPVNPNTGQSTVTNINGFSTANAVTQALANGVNVNLCVTMFSGHTTFFASSTAQQTLITNLITLVQNRGAHGVNVDFESMYGSNKTGFKNFIIDLSTQMKNAIPNAQISIALHAVEWSSVYDIPALLPHVDLFCIMGYDYYYGGSTNAGPTDPLFHFGNSYNYTLSRSVTYYLDKGVPENKMILAIPYYGRQWQVNNFSTPATTVAATGSSVTYEVLKNNSSGNYSSSNRNVESASNSVYYNFTSSGNNYQCFITEESEMQARLDFIRKRDLAGMGMWALGFDDGYPQFWNAINDKMTDCYVSPCSGTITDIGGGEYKNYYDKEDYSFTIAPPGATNINVQFQSFNLESGYDYLYIYDGMSTSSSQIPGSPFTGSSIPSSFTSTGGAITVKFTSDGLTTGTGFKATYNCATVVVDPPMTMIDTLAGWKSTNYNQTFVESVPGSQIKKMYYSVADHNGSEWRANSGNGFFYDNFDDFTIHSNWTAESGTWSETNVLSQTDEAIDNTNIYAPLNQSLSNHHVYHWKGKMGGAGTNRRAGLHIFVDDPTATNRNNSYFVYCRLDDNKIQFYKVENDVFGSPKIEEPYVFNANTWYDFKLIYDRITGEIWIYVNDELQATWTDSDPIVTGDYVSFRNGNCSYEVDDFMVYRSRYPSVQIKIGAASNNDIRYQNPNPSQPSGMIRSLITNTSDMISDADSILVNVDWTAPAFNYVNDGNVQIDLDTIPVISSVLEASANWSANDPNSGIIGYEYAIGTQPNDNSIVNWTPVGLNSSVTLLSQNFVYGDLYYFTVQGTNGAGLSGTQASNGFRLIATSGLNNGEIEMPRIYPNPATDYLNIELSQTIEEVSLYDMNGKLLFKVSVNAQSIPIDVVDFASGTYVLRLKTKSQVTEHTWIKK